MDYRKGGKNIFANSTTLESLKEPINKRMKPNQIYNDYFSQASNPQDYFNLTKQEKECDKNLAGQNESCFNYNYYKNNYNFHQNIKRSASPKKNNSPTPSPIRGSAKTIFSQSPESKSPSRYALPKLKLKKSTETNIIHKSSKSSFY